MESFLPKSDAWLAIQERLSIMIGLASPDSIYAARMLLACMLSRLKGKVKQDSEKVRDAAAQDKHMPDGMIVRDFFPDIEDNTGGVKQPAD